MAEELGKPVMAGATQIDMTNHIKGRRMVRHSKNPLDVCTIVSIFPVEIEEYKYTLEQCKYVIPPGSYEKPSVLVVTGSSWWKDFDFTQPLLEIPVGAMQLSESIIRDYCNGMLGCNMADAMPGLFYVEGRLTSAEIKMKYKQKLDEAQKKQTEWYKILVRLADSLWARTNGVPLSVWEIMRTAARALNLSEKPYLKDQQVAELIRCVACGSMRNPLFPICPTCKSIDHTHPNAKDLKFAV